jgi:hypothetical protein
LSALVDDDGDHVVVVGEDLAEQEHGTLDRGETLHRGQECRREVLVVLGSQPGL